MSRVLIVGVGSIGSRRARLLAGMGHTILLHDTDDRRITGVCADLRGADIVTACNLQLAELFDYGKPDAAFICTPAHTHVQLATECVERNIPVFVEKPLSNSNEGIPELLAAVEKAGIVNMGACNLRFAYDLPDDDWAHLGLSASKPLSEWRAGAESAYGPNGVILEAAIHEMDFAVSKLGRIRSGEVEGSNNAVRIRLRHEGGATSRIVADWNMTASTTRLCLARRKGSGREVFLPILDDSMYRREMNHFLTCVRENRPTCNPLTNAAHVLDWALRFREQVKVAA